MAVIPNVPSQQYRLDWAGSENPDEVNTNLARLWTNADEMIQTLFDDLNSTINAVNAAMAGTGSSTSLMTSAQIAARLSVRV